MRLLLGVDAYEESSICKYCGAVLDCKGIHALSCMSGGDVLLRPNEVRDIIYRFCQRARLRLELEKVGLPEEESILVNLRRPADVLMDLSGSRASEVRSARVALDVKVINGLGQDHLAASSVDGLGAAEAYREQQKEHLNTAALCSERGIAYEPIVFTAQGGIGRHTEAFLSRIAAAIASEEEISAAEAKSSLIQTISRSLARSAAKAVARRKPPTPTTSRSLSRALAEAHVMDVG